MAGPDPCLITKHILFLIRSKLIIPESVGPSFSIQAHIHAIKHAFLSRPSGLLPNKHVLLLNKVTESIFSRSITSGFRNYRCPKRKELPPRGKDDGSFFLVVP